MAKGVTITVEVKQNGVFLVIDRPSADDNISRQDVMKVIEDHAVKDVDFGSVNEIFSATELHFEKLISTNTEIDQGAGKVLVELSKNKLEAKIKFDKIGSTSGAVLKRKILAALEGAGVRYGVFGDVIDMIVKNPMNDGNAILIARGDPPTDGKDGIHDLNFDNSSKTYAPKIMSNGKADYRELDLVKTVNRGQLLITSIPPVMGADGKNVLGQVVAAKQGRPAPPLPVGKNVQISEDGSQLFASASGQVLYDGRKISISPILEIPGSVDNTTGNIVFNGAVVIKGSVRSGFTVQGEGNVEVLGVVESAKIISDYNVFLYSGVKGGGKAFIKAEGDITVKYAENCTMEAGRNIVASCIIHSDVKCKGYLEVSGKNGSFIGGKAKVRQKIEANQIGSAMAALTEIEVGLDPGTLEEYRNCMAEFNKFKTEYIKVDKFVNNLSELNKKTALDDEKKNLLLRSIHMKIFLREKIDEQQKKIDAILPELNGHKGIVVVKDVIHSGVKVLIGNAMMYVRDDIRRCTLKNVDGKIIIGAV